MDEEDPQQQQQQQQQAESGERGVSGLLPGLQGAEAGALQLRIKNSICKSVQSKVENILQDVDKFSDVEKLYLYLNLPSGSSSNADKSDQSALSSSRTQQMHAFGWINGHLEEYPETSLPKQEVYDEYKSFCDNLNYHPLSAADFGKMMKNVFPNMKARRLGMRGKSKYCYSGLRKRPFVHMPSLPSLELHKTAEGHQQSDVTESMGQLGSIKEDVRFAACDLVCEWAQKVLKRQFDAVEDLARFLIDSHYISNKSLAALTISTGTATENNPPQSVSAFVPASEAHSFLPHGTNISSPSVDAKQQLQRKIQRKQQEQKLHSPSPGEGQGRKPDDCGPCASPPPPSPQPTIGIMVAAVPSPITVQRSGQLISHSPVGVVENKVLPINFHMLTQPVQAVKQKPQVHPNILAGAASERTARQRYAQILPKPLSTTAITLSSPSTMIIANSPIKTVMTTCHVSPVSLVKMTAISLTPNSGTTTTTTTSLTNTTLQSASPSISSSTVTEGISNNQMRSTPLTPTLATMAGHSQAVDQQAIDVEMEIEAIHKNSQVQNPISPLLPPQDAMSNRAGGFVQRAASVPILQSREFLTVQEYPSNATASFNTVEAVKTSNTSATRTSNLHLSLSTQSSNTLSMLRTKTPPLLQERSGLPPKDGFLSTQNLRKRSGQSPDLSTVKRVFMPQQAVEGAAVPGYGFRNTGTNPPRLGAPARPESAPVSREVEMRMISASASYGQTLYTSSIRASGFCSVAKTQSSMQRKNTSSVMETGSSVSRPLLQQQHAHTMDRPNNSVLQKQLSEGDSLSSNSAARNIEAADQQRYTQSSATNEHYFNQAPLLSQLPEQTDAEYFPFDDDVTQDSIVEELVQMEEQMKLNNLQQYGNCVMPQSQHDMMPDNMMASNQAMAASYHVANAHCNPIQTPTPTPTPTPTSEMVGGARGMMGESPCISSTTPVDNALGGSCHTPVGTPHSNCSSNVPPSPVECRNPFAFTPINSSVTGLHDGSTVSSSPVKPMQRPMATHPDKTRLEWINNSYNNNSGSLNKSNSGSGILPSYQSLIGNHFQKPHAFAVPHARHHDNHFGRLTPISPVQQQVAGMASLNKQEGFAVPAPLDNKANVTASPTSRCRSVSPAVHQRNLSGNTGSLSHVARSLVSPFNSPTAPELLSIFANSQPNVGMSSMAQRSHSVPLNIMMQTEVSPTQTQQCSSDGIANVLLSKMDGNIMQGLGINNLASSYTARMNLTQILESDTSLSCDDSQLNTMTSDSSASCKMQGVNYDREIAMNEQTLTSTGQSPSLITGGHQHPPHSHPSLLSLSSRQHQQLDFSSTVKDLLMDNNLTAGNSLAEQSGLSAGGADVPCGIRMKSELPSSMSDLNALDTNLLFDPSQQQVQYQNSAAQELVNDPLFQQITNEVSHSGGLDWLESKDHPTVGLMG